MKIFETYKALQDAMRLPAEHPAAYRFLPAFGVAGFQCAECGVVRVFPLNSIGTGYGVMHGQMFCYDCCINRDRQEMQKHKGPFYAYVSSDRKKITAWPGGYLGTIHCYSESRTGWNGGKIARFHVRDSLGNWWAGRGVGAGMACTLRPMKRPDYAKSWGKK